MPRPNRGPYLKYLKERGKFYVFWSERGVTRKHSTGSSDRAEAEAALAQILHRRQLLENANRPRDPHHFPVTDALSLYGELRGNKIEAPERLAYAIEALLPFWGERSIGEINEDTCSDYAAFRNRAAGTVRRELAVLRAAINFAVRRRKITYAPAVFLPDVPQGRERWLTGAEVARLLNAARTGRSDVRLYLPLFILIGLYTGARKEAILSLRWTQIDLERGTIDFNEPGRRTTNKRRARIPIPDRLMTFLRLARTRGSDLGYVVNNQGARLQDIKRAFGAACQRAALNDVTPHTLRHTCGTWLAHRGVPLFEIAGWLGQTNERTVQLYAHHHPDYLAKAKAAFSGN